jgi:uncharacterized iron-regulated protein
MSRPGGPQAPRLLVVAVLLSCASVPAPAPVPSRGPILDVQRGVRIDEDRLLDALAPARFVLLGERHDNAEHHRLQAGIVRGLVARGRRPAVAFEMLRADVAAPLAEATQAGNASPGAVRAAVGWDASGWPDFALYEPVFAAALEAGLPLSVGDLPGALLSRVRDGGLAGLDPGTRARLRLDAAGPGAQREALAHDIVTGHCGLLPDAAVPRLVDVQLARDAHLALALETAASQADGAVLIAGAGHVRRDWGVPWWLELRAPGASVRTLAFLETTEPEAEPGPEADRYDFVWYTAPADDEDPCETFRDQLEALGRGH